MTFAVFAPSQSAPPPDRYERLDSARWLAAVAVVLLHSAAQALSDHSGYGTSAWMAANIYDSAMRWCVPVFVMISGALLLDNTRVQALRTFYGRRMTRIVVPLVFWSVFYLVWRATFDRMDGGHTGYTTWLTKLLDGTPYYHLWYLYMILGLYLFAPFVRNLYARTSPQARIICVGIIFGIAILDALYRQLTHASLGFFLTWFLPFLGYFVAGRLIFEGVLRIPAPVSVMLVSIAVTVTGVYIMSDAAALHGYFYDYFSLTVPFMSLAVFQLIVNGPKLPRLTALVPLTFGVYLVHPIFLDLAERFGAYQPGRHDVWAIPVLAAAVFCLSAGLAWLLMQNRLTARLI